METHSYFQLHFMPFHSILFYFVFLNAGLDPPCRFTTHSMDFMAEGMIDYQSSPCQEGFEGKDAKLLSESTPFPSHKFPCTGAGRSSL